MPTTIRSLHIAAIIGGLLSSGCPTLAAQIAPTPPDAPEARRGMRGMTFMSAMAARSYLGITLRTSSGPADTLGLLVESVDEQLPAAKAGIRAGGRLVSVDGIDLRLDARDIGDGAAERLPESRLRRQLDRKQPGETVTLVVLVDGRRETKSVVLAESPMARTIRSMSAGRRVLGMGFSQRGSMRDSAGLLIMSITTGGAADKAGLVEGDRVVSIDGIDLRVAAADAGTSDGVSARVSRFRRALDAAQDSTPVKLDVLSEGRRRTVSLLPTRERGITINMSGLEGMAADIRGRITRDFELSPDDRAELTRARVEAQREGVRARAEVQREMARTQRDMARDGMQFRFEDRRDSDSGAARGTIRGRTDGATLALSGLSLASVDRDFAQLFGKGSERGALVIRTRESWSPLKAGDVLLTIDGRSVRDGNSLDVTFDRSRD